MSDLLPCPWCEEMPEDVNKERKGMPQIVTFHKKPCPGQKLSWRDWQSLPTRQAAPVEARGEGAYHVLSDLMAAFRTEVEISASLQRRLAGKDGEEDGPYPTPEHYDAYRNAVELLAALKPAPVSQGAGTVCPECAALTQVHAMRACCKRHEREQAAIHGHGDKKDEGEL